MTLGVCARRRALAVLVAVAVLAAGAHTEEVEIRVQDFSFADGPSERATISIEAQDIKSSDLLRAAFSDDDSPARRKSSPRASPPSRSRSSQASLATAPSTERSSAPPASARANEQSKQQQQLQQRVSQHKTASVEQPPISTQLSESPSLPTAAASVAATATAAADAATAAVTAAADAMLELSTHEQAVVLVVVLCALCLAALVGVSVWNLVRFVWQLTREQRALRALFLERDVEKLRVAVSAYPAASPLLIRRVALARLEHLEFVAAASELNVQLSMLSLDDDTLVLSGLPPRRGDAKRALSLLEVLDALEQLRRRGDSVMLELLQLVPRVPPRWHRYVDTRAWLTASDTSLAKLHAHSVRVEQLSTHIADLLMDKLQAGEAIAKSTLEPLLAALRPSSEAESDDADSRSHSNNSNSSNSNSASMSASASQHRKDELSFFVKAFDEIHEQQQVKHELRHAMQRYSSTTKVQVSTRTTQDTTLWSESEFESDTTGAALPQHDTNNGNGSDTSAGNGLAVHASSDHEQVVLTRKLERCIDRAEALGVTHFEEVERAQDALERARRDTFCAALFNKDAKTLESLALEFVSMGAKRTDAVLKAGEILANRSNTLLLVSSLRGMFDDLRKQDLVRMDERRKRDAAKQLAHRARMREKFAFKQQLAAEKRAAKHREQQQRDAAARHLQRCRDAQLQCAQLVAQRQRFVWRLTKFDALIVLIVMALVFVESLRQLAFLQPVCRTDSDAALSRGVLSLFGGATNSLAVLTCQVAFGAKMAALLLALTLAFAALAQLQLLAVVLPVALGVALYYVRAEWMNMLLRTPLVGVIYAFNAASLYALTRSVERGAVATAEDAAGDDALLNAPLPRMSKRRLVAAYALFPLLSVALSVLVGIGIACDDPQQCATTAYRTLAPAVHRVIKLAREAYGYE